MRLLMILAVVVVGCSPGVPRPGTPWESDLNGGRLIYHADQGLGWCSGMSACPTRIVQIGEVCVTETYREGTGWEFRESKPCGPVKP